MQKCFGSKVGFWRPKYGGDYLYNNSDEKGQLLKKAVKSKLDNFRWAEKLLEDKTMEIGREKREKLLETPILPVVGHLQRMSLSLEKLIFQT